MCDTGNHESGNHRTYLNALFYRESFSGKSLKKIQVWPGGEIVILLKINAVRDRRLYFRDPMSRRVELSTVSSTTTYYAEFCGHVKGTTKRGQK